LLYEGDYPAFETQGQPAKLNIQARELLPRFEGVDTQPRFHKLLDTNFARYFGNRNRKLEKGKFDSVEEFLFGDKF
jgi:hypothetical protein